MNPRPRRRRGLGAGRIRNPRYSLIPVVLCLPLGVLAAATAYCAVSLPSMYRLFEFRHPACVRPFAEEGIGPLMTWMSWVGCSLAGLFALAALAGTVRRPGAIRLLRLGLVGSYTLAVLYTFVVLRITSVIVARGLPVGGVTVGAYEVFVIRCAYLLPAGAAAAFFALLHAVTLRRGALALYAPPPPPGPARGDEIFENLRTHGRDPRYRKSVYSSLAAHLAVLVVIPWLWALRGCVSPYNVPWGSGTPSVARVMFVQRKVKKQRKKFILRPDSKIIWESPDLDESEIQKQVDQLTQLTYEADVAAVHGKMGAGGGSRGGWPEGVPGGELRFIRIQYRGAEWDDGMDDKTRADVNFLNYIRKEVPFRVARKGEAHRIGLLPRYPPGRAPPFMYMTGNQINEVFSAGDNKVLREYCLGGGMLFADAGAGRFDRDFRSWIGAVFPDKRLVDIPDDDPIFQMPYVFPNGCPPLWHHGGWRAMGIKHQGRWCVFYHPGDLNDAWKTGNSGLEKRLAEGAFQMGVNVIYYAVTNYLEQTRRLRK